MSSYVVVLMTASDEKEASKIVRSLLDDRLIACANIIGPVSSLFWWEGKIDKASEVLVTMKSRKRFFKRLCDRVKKMHSYELPEILELPITEGLPSYLEWMGASLHGDCDG
ncbi:MAG: divalent-cation tolerance protein CutA [Candidatus Bathyarchaeota archaeon]|nr:MAG: divalent-cation tolerance protein CutA [Candidatus Bathyarchaeota archaeon]